MSVSVILLTQLHARTPLISQVKLYIRQRPMSLGVKVVTKTLPLTVQAPRRTMHTVLSLVIKAMSYVRRLPILGARIPRVPQEARMSVSVSPC